MATDQSSSAEAVLLVCDVGSTINSCSLEQVKQICLQFLLRFISYGSWRQIFGVLLMGSKQAGNPLHNILGGYQHCNILIAPEKPNVSFIKSLQELSVEGCYSDYIDALCVATDCLLKTIRKRKLLPRVVLITDGKTKQVFTDQLETVLTGMKEHQIRFDLIGVDSFLQDEACPTQLSNAVMLYKLVEHLDGMVMVVSFLFEKIHSGRKAFYFEDAMKELEEPFRRKSVLRAKFSGFLEIASIQIPIHIHTYCREFKPPNGRRVCLSETKETGRQVLCVESNHYFSMEDDHELQPDEMIEGHFYGRSLIPVSPYDMLALSYGAPKCFSIVGFISKHSIHQSMFMSGVDVVIADAKDKIAFTYYISLAEGMLEMERVALCRLVRKDNNAPELMLLWPHLKSDGILCLFLCQLPFVEDRRNFSFTCLDSFAEIANADQKEALKNFIRNRQMKETFKSTDIFHWYYQRLLHAIQERAVYQVSHTDEEPTLYASCPYLARVLSNEFYLSSVSNENQVALHNISQQFTLSQVEKPKKRKKSFDSKTFLYASSVAIEAYLPHSDDSKDFEKVKDEPMIMSLTDQEQRSTVGESTPVGDFESMMTNKRHDWLDRAMKQMQELITNLLKKEATSHRDDMVIHCLMAFRRRCILEGEKSRYNGFVQDIVEMAKRGQIDIQSLLQKDSSSMFSLLEQDANGPVTPLSEIESFQERIRQLRDKSTND
eukprot:jgi/Galph1/4412/GphlegSOOS_G3060.1